MKSTKRIHPTNQEIERGYFELFQNAYNLPAGKIEYGDKPDVTITGARKLGIEITNLYLEEGASTDSEQVQSRWRESAVSLAQTLYMEKGGKNVEFRFGFNKAHPIKDLKTVARKIAALAPLVDDRRNGQISRSEYAHIPELDFVYLYARQLQYGNEPDPEFPNGAPDVSQDPRGWMNYRNRQQARALEEGRYTPLPFTAEWDLTQAHSFGLMSTQRLEEIVRVKEFKAKEYRPCAAYWLLIVVEFIDPAQEQEIRVDGLTMTSDIFERIIVYKPRFEHIVELTPQPANVT